MATGLSAGEFARVSKEVNGFIDNYCVTNELISRCRKYITLDEFYHVRILRISNKNEDILEFDLKHEAILAHRAPLVFGRCRN